MTLHEPATFVTDLLLAALGLCLALKLSKSDLISPARRWWIRAMSLMAASALAGGFYHGFAPEFPILEPWWWRVVLWIICGLGFAIGMSMLHELGLGSLRFWRMALAAKLATFAIAVFFKPEFVVAMADYGSAIIAWLIAAICVRASWRGPMLAGLGLSILAGVIQQTQWKLHARFNHNDLFHVIQAMALIAFYHAGRRLGPEKSDRLTRGGLAVLRADDADRYHT